MKDVKRLTLAEVDALVSKFPPLVSRARAPKSSSQSLAARNIRSLLAHHFPEITFKVTTTTYNGGSRIDVNWTAWEDQDPPPVIKVKEVVQVFSEAARGSDVDAYKDGYQYDPNPARIAFREVFGCAQHVHCTSLEPTDEALAERRGEQLDKAFQEKPTHSPRVRM